MSSSSSSSSSSASSSSSSSSAPVQVIDTNQLSKKLKKIAKNAGNQGFQTNLTSLPSDQLQQVLEAVNLLSKVKPERKQKEEQDEEEEEEVLPEKESAKVKEAIKKHDEFITWYENSIQNIAHWNSFSDDATLKFASDGLTVERIEGDHTLSSLGWIGEEINKQEHLLDVLKSVNLYLSTFNPTCASSRTLYRWAKLGKIMQAWPGLIFSGSNQTTLLRHLKKFLATIAAKKGDRVFWSQIPKRFRGDIEGQIKIALEAVELSITTRPKIGADIVADLQKEIEIPKTGVHAEAIKREEEKERELRKMVKDAEDVQKLGSGGQSSAKKRSEKRQKGEEDEESEEELNVEDKMQQ